MDDDNADLHDKEEDKEDAQARGAAAVPAAGVNDEPDDDEPAERPSHAWRAGSF